MQYIIRYNGQLSTPGLQRLTGSKTSRTQQKQTHQLMGAVIIIIISYS